MTAATLHLTIPLTPPSVNHYIRHLRSGRHYVTKEAKAYKAAIGIIAQGRKVEAKSYQVDLIIYLGKGERLDHDNGWKVVGDGLQEAGVISSDSKIRVSSTRMERDPGNPRTEIHIRAL